MEVTENTEHDFDKLDNSNDDDDDNSISVEKIKASVLKDDEDDRKTVSDIASENRERNVLPEINLQEPFQPGSSPTHLLSRYMVLT